ncbi:MAG: hypothetical protein IJU74_06055 [Bacteroidales bacterium]|nr:hypothetical protein [Bacteroidales bacterium]
MPPPARGCLRSEGLVPGGQAGVAGGTLPRQTQEGDTLPCQTQEGSTLGWKAGQGGMRRHATPG